MNASTPIELPGGTHAALLLHGLGGSPLEVRFVARLLHRAGFSVLVPTLPGYSMGEEVAPLVVEPDERVSALAAPRQHRDVAWIREREGDRSSGPNRSRRQRSGCCR